MNSVQALSIVPSIKISKPNILNWLFSIKPKAKLILNPSDNSKGLAIKLISASTYKTKNQTNWSKGSKWVPLNIGTSSNPKYVKAEISSIATRLGLKPKQIEIQARAGTLESCINKRISDLLVNTITNMDDDEITVDMMKKIKWQQYDTEDTWDKDSGSDIVKNNLCLGARIVNWFKKCISKL